MPYSSMETQSFLMPKILTGGRLFSGSVIVRNLVIHVHPTMWYHVPVPPVNRTDLHVRPNERCAILEIFFLQGVTVSSVWHQKHCKLIKAIVDIRLCPRCALPSSPSRLIGRIACAQIFPDFYLRLPGILNDPFCCMTLLVIE